MKQAARKADKHLGGTKKAVKRVKKVHKVAKQVHQMASPQNSGHQTAQNHPTNKKPQHVNNVQHFEKTVNVKGVGTVTIRAASGGHRHRRDLEADEELSRRDLDTEGLFGREYDDFWLF